MGKARRAICAVRAGVVGANLGVHADGGGLVVGEGAGAEGEQRNRRTSEGKAPGAMPMSEESNDIA